MTKIWLESPPWLLIFSLTQVTAAPTSSDPAGALGLVDVYGREAGADAVRGGFLP